MGRLKGVSSVWFRPYMKAGRMSVVEVDIADTSAYMHENFMTDANGNYVQFVTEDEAINWLHDNIKTELIHEDYVETLIRPSSNREYWLKDEVLKQEKVVQIESAGVSMDSDEPDNGEVAAKVLKLVTYRLYVQKGKVTVVRILGGNISEYNPYAFMDNADGSELVFDSEGEAVEWMAAKLQMKTIHPDYLERAGYTVYREREISGESEDYSPSGFSR
ncbi:hypothetical protein FT641_18370 [Bacillus paranthracis]|uniref:hypothetical protein n=1 Tax=Bacillus paranthracis TaxID=2026186 RepID=UPI0018797550|nr:hypothetical protein [Bacillus paranthracis]MBE7114471.1 hypothetical protein [Bacillus paranthracis]MBE7154655.1 hypothetical protein [Bacillus paranthracis]